MLGSEACELRDGFNLGLQFYRVSVKDTSILGVKADVHTYLNSLLVHHECEWTTS